MTTASADNSAGSSWFQRLLMNVGHYQDRYAIVLVPLAFSDTATDLMHLSPTATAIVDKVNLLALVGWLVSLVAEWKHDRTLCPLDLDQAPLSDPQGAIDRELWKLKIFHNSYRSIGIMLGLALCFAGIKWLERYELAWTPWLKLVLTALFITVYLVASELAGSAHRRLAPWCPFCRRGGGGGGYFQPEPTTPPTNKITV